MREQKIALETRSSEIRNLTEECEILKERERLSEEECKRIQGELKESCFTKSKLQTELNKLKSDPSISEDIMERIVNAEGEASWMRAEVERMAQEWD